jgi:MoaA/NifB/PqqE/SkfB family radical SAM enzyme
VVIAMSLPRLKRKLRSFERRIREARMIAKALKSPRQPILAHVVPMRRCNLSCAYCNEYDSFSNPVPTAVMCHRIERLAALGTSVVTISGGEPLLHPDLDEIIRCIRDHGMLAELITNGYLLTPQCIARLNRAGLDHLQISIDNVMPDEVSKKSLKVLDRKLQWLARGAEFDVNINSVLGSSLRNPEDALTIARRALALGLQSTIGLIHDGTGQLRKLSERQQAIYESISKLSKPFYTSALYKRFYENLARGRPNDWHCRAGSRYLYICEDGFVHYCSQQRGYPGIPLEQYTSENLEREYHTIKPCAPYCTIPCVQRVAMVDEFRESAREALVRFFPSQNEGEATFCDLPVPLRILTWLFLPPAKNSWRNPLTRTLTRAALLSMRIK